MKKILALCALLLATAPAWGDTFEGKVTMHVTNATMPATDLLFSMKEGHSRIDTQMQGMSAGILFNPAAQEMTILMNSQKMYMVRAMPKPTEGSAADGKTPTTAVIEKTGIKEKILGYDTTKYVTTDNGVVTQVWLTDQLGAFMGTGPGTPAGRRGGSTAAAWEQLVAGKNQFPLRVISTKSDTETMRMEATSVEKQKLPDSLFVPPPDFQKFDMGQMMRGMMPGGAGTPGK